MAPNKCAYLMCNNTSDQISMFRFPSGNPTRLEVWLSNCGNITIAHLSRNVLHNRYLCLEHFDEKYLRNVGGKRTRLTKTALPKHYKEEENMSILPHCPIPSTSTGLGNESRGERTNTGEVERGGASPATDDSSQSDEAAFADANTFITMNTFIEGVRLQPCIWNPSHPEYREMCVKDDAWRRVVEHYNDCSIPNIHVAKTEWKKLRDNHRDALKRAKLGRNKLLPAQITTWKYAKAMQFLEPHMKYRITENIEMDPPTETTKNPKSSDSDVSTTETAEALPGNSHAAKRRCLEHNNEFCQNTDALESFFSCILKSTKTMPTWMQTQVKKKIFAVIIEAEEHLSSQKQQVTEHEQPDHVLSVVSKIKTEIYTDESYDNDY